MVSRLGSFIDYTGLSVRAFALKCGLKQNTLSNQLNGNRELSLVTIKSIATAFPELSLEWLFYGEGGMLRSESKETERINAMLDTITLLQETIRTKDETIKMLMKRISELENK